jgi:CubicO group peptidase (beta-lactamase class C family)
MKTLIKNGRIVTTVLGITLLLIASCSAQDATAAKIDDYIKSEMQKQQIPGVSLAIVKDGKVVLEKGYGFSNIEHRVPVKPETIFQSGSLGKQFTATAVMLLVEDGKINLDEKISKYLGDVPESWKNMTVRHLLTHTSGMADYPDKFDYRRDYTEEELLTIEKALPPVFQPGEKWEYCNLGYATLGILIHKVTGKFYGDFLQERIFKPLGMTTARVISETDIVPNRAAGYTLVKGELKNQEWVSPTVNSTADGSLYLTVKDMVKWDAALNGEKLLKKTSLAQMWTPVKLNDGKTAPYGFGWALGEINKQRIIEHGGEWQGFKSYIARYPDIGLTVIFFANLAQAKPATLTHGVAGIYDTRLSPNIQTK